MDKFYVEKILLVILSAAKNPENDSGVTNANILWILHFPFDFAQGSFRITLFDLDDTYSKSVLHLNCLTKIRPGSRNKLYRRILPQKLRYLYYHGSSNSSACRNGMG